MDNYYFNEYVISLNKCDNWFMTESALIDACFTEATFEEFKAKAKDGINKIVKLFKQLVQNLIKLTSELITKAKIKIKLKQLKSILKRNPELGTDVIELRYLQLETTNDFTQFSKNFLSKAKLYKNDKELYELLNKFESAVSSGLHKRKVTMIEGIEMTEDMLERYDKVIHETVNSLVHFTELKTEDDSKKYRLTSRLSNVFKSLNLTMVSSMFDSIDSLYSGITSNVKQQIRHYASLVSIRTLSATLGKKNTSTQVSSLKPITKFNIDGREIPVYYGDKDNFSPAAMVSIGEFSTYVVVKPSFMKLSKDVQNAVLYHELGHYVNNHAGRDGVRNTEKDIKTLKKDVKEFNKISGPMQQTLHDEIEEFYSKNKKYADKIDDQVKHNMDNNLVYILKELEADRYAISQGAKKSYFKDVLCGNKDMNDNTREIMTTRYKMM